MSSASRVCGLIFVASWACSSPELLDAGMAIGSGGAQATLQVAAGAAGKAATSAGAAGVPAAPTSSASAGSIARAGNAAGAVAQVAGMGGVAGAGSAGHAGDAGAISMSMGGSGGTTGGAMATGGSNSAPSSGCEVAPITADMRDDYEYMNDMYYTKFASANGVIVATGSKVVDEALVRYCRLLSEMLSNEKVRQGILAEKMWFTMISQSEQLSSLPQINKQYGTSLNARARGLGALTPTICAEDSIMCMKGDPWNGDCICPHETGHTLYSSGIAKVPELSKRLTSITNSVKSSGRLSNAYVWQDGNESGMMSWGVQAWYNCAINGKQGEYHTDINTREELKKELPDFYQFLSELLPEENQYKDCYYKQ